ncbi:MepB family protein [Paraflavitalea sp. CAU 1676]|uniref:MepB family protein n=1 Tax=Paraflavitalea sp. CAU 1676 TaxID=3032598 RepID=UPI0023D9E153|nr:MepB family protein [Paraflavitalea sp. CAU 1676]MDF2190482.1 MepB family protein [Paraflavitalea sp. CAU 1676]
MSSPLHPDLSLASQLLYEPAGLTITHHRTEPESQEYSACSFQLNLKKVQFRVAKITPTKNGQFVAIWRRNKKGITQPFEATDDIDFLIISARNNDQAGQFLFPKPVLIEQAIISTPQKEGKRGIRIYPPWDTPTSKQAAQTQRWQAAWFALLLPQPTHLQLIKRLFCDI